MGAAGVGNERESGAVSCGDGGDAALIRIKVSGRRRSGRPMNAATLLTGWAPDSSEFDAMGPLDRRPVDRRRPERQQMSDLAASIATPRSST